MDCTCTIPVAKIKALISFAVNAKLICVFVLAYAKSGFSHNEAQMSLIRRQSAFGVSEKTARGLKFWILEVEELFNLCSKKQRR